MAKKMSSILEKDLQLEHKAASAEELRQEKTYDFHRHENNSTTSIYKQTKKKTISQLHEEFASLFEQMAVKCHEIAQTTTDSNDYHTETHPQKENPIEDENQEPRYSIAPGFIGKFAQLIQAMYDEKMFLKADGTPASSVKDVAQYIGPFLGIDFDNWQQTLRGAVLPDSSIDFFSHLKDNAERYKRNHE